MSLLLRRMARASRLEAAFYEEVEADPGAMGQAVLVVLLYSVAAAIGGASAGGKGLILGLIGGLIGWFLWAFVTWVVGTKLLPEAQTQADLGQLLRTIGFSCAPGLLQVFGFIPVLGPLVILISSFWMLAAMVVAVRQALDFKSTGRALAVCLIGFLLFVAVRFVLGLLARGAGAALTA